MTSISARDDDDFCPNGVLCCISSVGGHWKWDAGDVGEGTMPGAAMANLSGNEVIRAVFSWKWEARRWR